MQNLWALSLTISFDLPFHSSEIQSHTEVLREISSIERYMLNILEKPRSEVEKLAGAKAEPTMQI